MDAQSQNREVPISGTSIPKAVALEVADLIRSKLPADCWHLALDDLADSLNVPAARAGNCSFPGIRRLLKDTPLPRPVSA